MTNNNNNDTSVGHKGAAPQDNKTAAQQDQARTGQQNPQQQAQKVGQPAVDKNADTSKTTTDAGKDSPKPDTSSASGTEKK